MATREIRCAHCGILGKIEIWGLNEGIPLPSLFRYLGHEPLSGHMHFQCPVCRKVCVASPLSVLNDDLIITRLYPSTALKERWASFISDLMEIGTKLVPRRPTWLNFGSDS